MSERSQKGSHRWIPRLWSGNRRQLQRSLTCRFDCGNHGFSEIGLDGSLPMVGGIWTEELIQPARAVEHPRLISLYVMATHCQIVGRIEEAQPYGETGQILLTSGRQCVPPGLKSWLGGIYTIIGQPGRSSSCSARCLQARGPVRPHGIRSTFLTDAGRPLRAPASVLAIEDRGRLAFVDTTDGVRS